jgi:hypothetical protein
MKTQTAVRAGANPPPPVLPTVRKQVREIL